MGRSTLYSTKIPELKSIHTLSNPVIAEKSNGFGIPETAGVGSLLCPEGNPAEVVAPAASDFSSSKRNQKLPIIRMPIIYHEKNTWKIICEKSSSEKWKSLNCSTTIN